MLLPYFLSFVDENICCTQGPCTKYYALLYSHICQSIEAGLVRFEIVFRVKFGVQYQHQEDQVYHLSLHF